MKKKVYLVEVGVLLDKDHPEYECYTIKDFFDNYCAFYDENRLCFFDYKQAQEYAEFYVNTGVVNTYAIVHTDIFNLTDEEIEEIENNASCEYIDNPTKESTLFFKYKNKENNIITEMEEREIQ